MALDNRKGPKAIDFSASFLFDFVGKDNKVYQFSSFFFFIFCFVDAQILPFSLNLFIYCMNYLTILK